MDRTHPGVLRKKKKPKQPKVHSQEDPNKTFVWGFSRYLPNPAESENERSIEIHIVSGKAI